MKNTVAGTSFILASIVCIVIFGILAMNPNFGIGASGVTAWILRIAWFVNVCLGIYYFNAEDKSDS
jgi:hypothetical protein